MNIPEWKSAVRRANSRSSPDEEAEFIQLMDTIRGHVLTADVADTLLLTFSSRDDFGTQEAVISALDSADDSIVVPAILRHLPRLCSESNEWARILVAGLVRERLAALQLEIVKASLPVRQSLRRVLLTDDFLVHHPAASDLAAQLEV